jgi:DNA (cytosine-5)-methyltransferase 1
MKIGSLCTGYGGLDMAVEAYFNAETIWCAEYDKHASYLINERFNIPNYKDIKSINWTILEPIDILTAGYPCQPFSVAGSRQGSNDERHLWPYIKEAISVLRPQFVILENVLGHLSLGFKEVLADLTEIGYDARWQVVRASDVGAPHQRARLFIIAYPNSIDWRVSLSNVFAANSINNGWTPRNTGGSQEGLAATESYGSITDSNSHACEESRRASLCLCSESQGLRNGQDQGQARHEYRFSLEMDRQSVPNTLDQDKLNPVFVEYMMGLPKGWVTDLDLPRTQKLKMLGNGVVPQQAYHALKLLCDTTHIPYTEIAEDSRHERI